MIRFETITEDNWRPGLTVFEEQKHWVSGTFDILARAYAYRSCRPHVYLICDDTLLDEDGDPTPVGMVLYHDCDAMQGYDFSQLFIDRRYQGRGYGKRASAMILDEMRRDGKYHKVVLCYIEGNTAAKHLYASLGFTETDHDGDEIIMELYL